MNQFRSSHLGSTSTTTAIKAKKASRFTRFYQYIWSKLVAFYRFSRRFLWVASTGLILMFLPLAFCYMSEVEMEVRKMGLAPNPMGP